MPLVRRGLLIGMTRTLDSSFPLESMSTKERSELSAMYFNMPIQIASKGWVMQWQLTP